MIVNLFVWKVRQIPDLAVIDLIGDIDSTAADGFREASKQALLQMKGNGGLLLNFSKAGYINSRGIALIIELLA